LKIYRSQTDFIQTNITQMNYSSENLKFTNTEMSPINIYPYSQKTNYNGTETLYDDNKHT